VANTAFGAASFLILEAVGATLLVQYGFINAFWAILATGLIIFLAGCRSASTRPATAWTWTCSRAAPASATSARPHLADLRVLHLHLLRARSGGDGLCAGTGLDIPPIWGYLVCALVVIPLVTHGVSAISRLQVWTQPLWLVMLVVPFIYVFMRDPGAFCGI
jgi:hypothetical protein